MSSYRPDVDGLRAISILLVLFFHAGTSAFGGGFVGVDVFFVISGYLITSIIYREIAKGSFSFLWFYERRARRILPALITVVLATAGAGYFLLYPGVYSRVGDSALATLVAASNFYFLTNTGYFDAPAQSMPLLHTWSLGVEEQFYLAWPLLMLVASRFCRNSRPAWIALLSLVAIASFAAALHEVARDPKAAFYLPYTRAWELAIGGLLCFAPPIRSRWAEALPPLGLAAIMWSAVALSAQEPFPGINALAPVIGAALVIYPQQTSLGLVLGRLAPLGRISYSLYLWHWPLIVLWRTYNNDAPLTLTEATLLIVASMGLSFLSWRYIEQPARRARFRHVLAVALAGELGAAALVAPIVATGGFPGRLPPEMAGLGDPAQMWAWKCAEMVELGLLQFPDTSRSLPTCVAGASWTTARHHAILWGDSNAEAILPLLDLVGRARDTAVALVNNCPAILHKGVVKRYWPELPTYNDYCEASRSAVFRLLNGDMPIELVILAASWTNLPSSLDVTDADTRSLSAGLQLMEKGFDDLLPRLAAENRRIIVFGDIPKWTFADPIPCVFSDVALARHPCGANRPFVSVVSFNVPAETAVHTVLSDTANRAHTIPYLPERFLCDPDKCRVFVNGEFLYRDGDHLRRNLQSSTLREAAKLLHLEELFDFSGLPTVQGASHAEYVP